MEITKHEFYDHQFTPWKDGKRTHERNWNAVRRWNNVEIGQCPKCGLRKEAGWRGAHAATCNHCTGPVHLKPARPRVFCAGLADWLDPEVPVEWLADLLALIHECPNLDFLLLTKRPGLFGERVNAAYEAQPGETGHSRMMARWTNGIQSTPPANVWIGTTIEDQKRADERIPELLMIPARVRFLSCEPLLGPVDLKLGRNGHSLQRTIGQDLHWVICGGESGPNARPMHPDWARGLRDQCDAAGVPFFFKQWGEWAPKKVADNFDCLKTPMQHVDDYTPVWKLGKHRAGRLLDGREHSAFPEVRS